MGAFEVDDSCIGHRIIKHGRDEPTLNCSSRVEELRSCLKLRLHRSRFSIETQDLESEQFGAWRKRTAPLNHVPKGLAGSDSVSCAHVNPAITSHVYQMKQKRNSRDDISSCNDSDLRRHTQRGTRQCESIIPQCRHRTLRTNSRSGLSSGSGWIDRYMSEITQAVKLQ